MPADVSQLQALGRTLDHKADQVKTLAEKVVAKAALDVEAGAKNMAAVDTGNMRNSIGAEIDGLTAVIGPSAPYGVYVEFGTSRMAAQPFMIPSFDEVVPSFTAAIKAIGGSL